MNAFTADFTTPSTADYHSGTAAPRGKRRKARARSSVLSSAELRRIVLDLIG